MESEDLFELVNKKNRPAQTAWRNRILRPLNLLWLFVPVLLWWALRRVPFRDILLSIQHLTAWQLAVLLMVNGLIFLMFGARWWLIIQSFGKRVPLLAVTVYRLAGFGVSYFTPGPQLGGEALQVRLLSRKHAIPVQQAISSVFLDKIIELLSNFTFLVLGIMTILASNILHGWLQAWMWPLIAAILAFPAVHLAALWQGRQPLTRLFYRLWHRWPENRFLEKVYSLVGQAEQQIRFLCREQSRTLLIAIVLSGLAWVVLVGEYILLVRFLGLRLSLAQTVIALTLARIAFLIPLPGGLGALEASQVLAMQAFGFDPAMGITICLVIRARDILSGGLGLALGGWYARQ